MGSARGSISRIEFFYGLVFRKTECLTRRLRPIANSASLAWSFPRNSLVLVLEDGFGANFTAMIFCSNSKERLFKHGLARGRTPHIRRNERRNGLFTLSPSFGAILQKATMASDSLFSGNRATDRVRNLAWMRYVVAQTWDAVCTKDIPSRWTTVLTCHARHQTILR